MIVKISFYLNIILLIFMFNRILDQKGHLLIFMNVENRIFILSLILDC
jgi:hypothetical protein